MWFRSLFIWCGITAFIAGMGQMAASPKKKNIILIMVDDMGYECVGTYGSTYSTPNLNRAATAGIRFNHCYSTPLCTPSRNEIMTGKYNHRNYVAFGYLDSGQKTFGNLFRDAGYATCIAGKWQLGGDAGTIHDFGFDEHCVWNMEQYHKSDQEKKSGNIKRQPRYWDPEIYQNGIWLDRKKENYGPDICADFMIDFIEKNQGNPFMAYYPSILVHSPFAATPDSENKEQGKAEKFSDMCTYIDGVVGRIEAKLKELDLYDNTVILFTADNGTHTSIETPMQDGSTVRGGKGSMTDGGTRVPLIVWGGGIRTGIASDSIVDFSDMLPTIADLAGIAVPYSFGIDGKSFKPVLTGEKETVRDTIFCFYEPKWGEWKRQVWARDHEYKLYGDGRFYHVPSDVLEQMPIKQPSEKQDAARRKLQSVLDSNLNGNNR